MSRRGIEKILSLAKMLKSCINYEIKCMEPLLQTQNIKKPYELWDAFVNLYSPKGFSSEFLICRELFNTNLAKCNNNMEFYLNQVKRLNDQLIAKKIIIPEKVIFAWVLNNLGNDYSALITAITQSIRVTGSDSLKLEELFSNLIDESKRVKSLSKENSNKEISTDEIALFTKSKKGKYKPYNQNKVNKSGNSTKTIKCNHCKKNGHKIDKCWIKNPDLRPKKGKDNSSCEETSEEIAMNINSDFRASVEKDSNEYLVDKTILYYSIFTRNLIRIILNLLIKLIIKIIYFIFIINKNLLKYLNFKSYYYQKLLNCNSNKIFEKTYNTDINICPEVCGDRR